MARQLLKDVHPICADIISGEYDDILDAIAQMNREACEREALRCARMAAACEREAAASNGRNDADRLRRGARHWRERGVMYREAAEDGRA